MSSSAARDPLERIGSTVRTLEGSLGNARTEPATPAQAPARPAPTGAIGSEPLGRYERGELLGEGGMGCVERAYDRDLLRHVAVKHLRHDLRGDARLLAQFLWEARVTAYLDHPNIVPVHDLGIAADGQPFFTMKLVRGESLEGVLARLRAREPEAMAKLTPERRMRLFLQLCHPLAFAHAKGVLHRDLKPANVMVGEFGEVLVTDWGIAVPLPGAPGDALRRLAPGGDVPIGSAGTPQYMSPEQARGEDLDERSDVYALGVILYELTALQRPIDGKDSSEILSRASRGETKPLEEACPGVSSTLAAVVRKAMARDRSDRYESARVLAEDVETVMYGRTPRADKASLVRQAARFYFARDPTLSRLRVVDIDMWGLGSFLMGAGAGVLLAARAGRLGWPLVALGFLVTMPSTVRWIRFRRNRPSDDPRS